jgi:hypothetical protein
MGTPKKDAKLTRKETPVPESSSETAIRKPDPLLLALARRPTQTRPPIPREEAPADDEPAALDTRRTDPSELAIHPDETLESN